MDFEDCYLLISRLKNKKHLTGKQNALGLLGFQVFHEIFLSLENPFL